MMAVFNSLTSPDTHQDEGSDLILSFALGSAIFNFLFYICNISIRIFSPSKKKQK